MSDTYRIVKKGDREEYYIEIWHGYWFGGGRWKKAVDHYKTKSKDIFEKVNFVTYEETEDYLYKFLIDEHYTLKICSTYEYTSPSY